jgi:hypothetical protein
MRSVTFRRPAEDSLRALSITEPSFSWIATVSFGLTNLFVQGMAISPAAPQKL